MISLPLLLQRSARLNPNGVATRFNKRDRNWPELIDRVARLASGLKTCGVVDGDRVAILSLNSDRYLEAVFAIPWAGLVMVPLNTRWAVAENSYAVKDSGAKILLFDDNFADQALELKQQLPGLETLIHIGEESAPQGSVAAGSLIDANPPSEPSGRYGADMAGIFYTGGTTGFPKGVMQSHQALWASAIGCQAGFQMDRDSIYLHAAPMFHMADFAGSIGTLLAGGTHVFVPGFEPKLVLDTVARYRITHVLIVPAMIKMLLNHPALEETDVSSLKMLMYGASPMPAAVLEQAIQKLPKAGFMQAYGQTELAPVVSVLTAEDHRIGGQCLQSAGRPSSVSSVRIVDEQGNDCPIGTSGEIAVSGPHAMLGYWNNPEQTSAAIRDGWVLTGDVGQFDEDGYLYIVDRVKDMIVTGGENVFTTEVENALISHPAVQDIAVIGIPSEEWGEAVHAIVIPAAGHTIDEQALIEHARQKIAGYKCPKSISVREEPFPLSGAGKVLKTELRKPFWEGRNSKLTQ